MAVLELRNIHRTFEQGAKKLEILRGVDLTVDAGETVALVGQSGSGKSTLLQIAGLLDHPTHGDIALGGENISNSSDKRRTYIRLNNMGFVYQAHHLLPDFTAVENAMMPLRIRGLSDKKAREQASATLRDFGLEDRLDHYPSKLSGGEQQRVAIARALIGEPALLLADEPTGNLDWETADRVMATLLEQAKKRGLAAVIATHDRELAKRMDRVVTLKEGQLAVL